MQKMADFYNETYSRPNFFHYKNWIFAPYVSSLISYCGLKKGDSVLDVGCGQGFFSSLFREHGLKVHGIDMSETGIRAATSQYGRLGITFSVADIQNMTFPQQFDCIFVRSCSLYNADRFPLEMDVTRNLLKHLKSSGTFIFAYNSNFSSKPSPKWRYHSLQEVRQHFSSWENVQVFFLDRLTPILLRKYSFSLFLTRVNIFLSKALGTGGDLICILKEPRLHS
jgi:SAM-dependent methyltransferase